MATVEMDAEIRVKTGKNQVKEIKRQGYIPSVMYGQGIEPISLKVPASILEKVYRTTAGKNTIINLNLIGKNIKDPKACVISCAIDRDPITDKLIHVDFKKLDLNQKISFVIPLHFEGTPPGVKMGGVFLHHRTTVEISCLPGDIPDYLAVDVSHMELGDSLHISDLQPPDTIEILTPPGLSVGIVEIPRGMSEEEEAAEAAEAEEGEDGVTEGDGSTEGSQSDKEGASSEQSSDEGD